VLALWLLIGAGVIGCGNDHVVQPAGLQDLGPAPDSPANAVRLLEWIYNHKSIESYRRLLADDFRSSCSPTDSSGTQSRGTPWTRGDELTFATHLFIGGGALEPPVSIRVAYDRNFFVSPDPNDLSWDASGRWHRSIRSALAVSIRTADGGAIEITGHANFFLVRGDSAVIPEELKLMGLGPDSTRWYLRRWDDETEPSGGAPVRAAQPSSPFTWCGLKSIYR